MKKRLICILTLLLLLMSTPALAQEAEDITHKCTFLRKTSRVDFTTMTDRKYFTYFRMNPQRVVEGHCTEDISALYVQFFNTCPVLDIHVEIDGQWQHCASTSGLRLTEWIPLPENVQKIRLINNSGAWIELAELTLFGKGDRPARIHQWRHLEKADLMLLVTHPDDDLLWFGGLLPTYAGEKDLAVQVVYLVPAPGYRRLELLDGLWHCGVEAYPLFCNMPDKRATTLHEQYKLWNKTHLLGNVLSVIRQVKPEVLVTQDVYGEYGHAAHRACADVCQLAATACADPEQHKYSVEKYGTWQLKKVYLHLYKENQLRMNWRIPLEAFGGKDSFTIATEALAFHKSQTSNGWAMEEGGRYDNSLFGLYFTTVGEDIAKDDFMENIPLDLLSTWKQDTP